MVTLLNYVSLRCLRRSQRILESSEDFVNVALDTRGLGAIRQKVSHEGMGDPDIQIEILGDAICQHPPFSVPI